MSLTFRAGLFSVLVWLMVGSAGAQDIVQKYSDQDLLKILESEGYRTVETVAKGSIKIKIDGNTYLLLNNEDGDLQLYYGETGRKIDFEGINIWNRTKRLSRAYIDKDGDPVIEADLLSNGGMMDEKVVAFIKIFFQSVRGFVVFLDKADAEK